MIRKMLCGAGALGASLFASAAAFAQEAAATAAAAATPAPAPSPEATEAAAAAATTLIKAPTVEQMATMVDKGDTAWMLVSTALVLLMSIPALALFYGGLVRTKNMLSVLMQVFMIVSIAALVCVHQRQRIHRRLLQAVSRRGLGFDLRRDILEQRLPARIRLRRVPDDVRLHHPGADRRRVCRAHQVHPADGVRGAVADRGLFPDRAHGVVLGRA